MNPWTALLNLLGSILAFFYSIVPNYGVAVIMLTLLLGAITFPLTLKQTRSMRAMQFIQPQVKKLQAEFKLDRQELNQRLMALYQENNVNPASGCLPLLVQMPIWIALFQAIILSLAVAPEALLNLSRYLYSWPVVFSMLPLDNMFLIYPCHTPIIQLFDYRILNNSIVILKTLTF